MKAWWGMVVVALVALTLHPALATVEGAGASGAVTLPALDSGTGNVAQGPLAQDKVERLILFTPRGPARVPEVFARDLQEEQGGSLGAYRQFFLARWREFQAALLRYDMQPNNLSTARAFAIVAGYRAYNGDHLRDITSGSIFRAIVAMQTAAPQWTTPWSDRRKQDLYAAWGLQGALLNWFHDDARRRGDAAQLALVRAEARAFLRQELGRDPDTVKLDNYACTVFRDVDCPTLMHQLRSEALR